MLKLLSLLKRDKKVMMLYLLGFLCKLMSVGLLSIQLYFFKNIFEEPDKLLHNAAIWAMIDLCSQLFYYGKDRLYIYCQSQYHEYYRYDIVNKILHMDVDNYKSSNPGEIFNAATNNMTTMLKSINYLTSYIVSLFSVVVKVVMMFMLNKYIGYIGLIIIPIIMFMQKRMDNQYEIAHKKIMKVNDKIMSKLDMIAHSFILIKSKYTFNNELDFINEQNKGYTEGVLIEKKSLYRFYLNIKVLSVITSLIIILLYNQIGLSAATGFVAISYIDSMLNPILNISEYMDLIKEGEVSYDKYMKIMNMKDIVKDGTININHFNSNIELSNVEFKYKDSDLILDNINLKINKGEKIGICGTSGGGKSSLISLINRFYDVTKGSIKIDGINIKDITEKSLRRIISYVSQECIIFNGTIKENVLYGTRGKTEEDLIEACKNVNILDFIKSLPDGFDTQVGVKGLKLSGGQRQRISIARAFLQDAPILLLDEATSALDNESETVVQEALDRLSNDKTTITIAHRLSTIKNSDRIIVIDNHKIVEQGTHEELLAMDGIYKKLNK